jgi:hypothetical protein
MHVNGPVYKVLTLFINLMLFQVNCREKLVDSQLHFMWKNILKLKSNDRSEVILICYFT